MSRDTVYVMSIDTNMTFIRQEAKNASQRVVWSLDDYYGQGSLRIFVTQEPNLEMGMKIPRRELNELNDDIDWLVHTFGSHHVFKEPSNFTKIGFCMDSYELSRYAHGESWPILRNNHKKFAGHKIISGIFTLLEKFNLNQVKHCPIEEANFYQNDLSKPSAGGMMI